MNWLLSDYLWKLNTISYASIAFDRKHFDNDVFKVFMILILVIDLQILMSGIKNLLCP